MDVFVIAAEFAKEALGRAHGTVVSELGGWGERAENGILDDFVDGLGLVVGVGLWEVDAGCLKAVEEDSGAARVELA